MGEELLFADDYIKYRHLIKGFFPRYYYNMTLQDMMMDIHLLRQITRQLQEQCKVLQAENLELKTKLESTRMEQEIEDETITENDELPPIGF